MLNASHPAPAEAAFAPTATKPPTPTKAPTLAPYQCPIMSMNRYVKGGVEQWDPDNPPRKAAEHADKNLALRGYQPTNDLHDFVTYGPTDPNTPPQFATIFVPDRMPIFMTL